MGIIQQPCTKMPTILFPQRKIVQQLSELKAVRFVETLLLVLQYSTERVKDVVLVITCASIQRIE